MYIVIKVGSGSYGATKFNDDFDLGEEVENIAEHASIGNAIIICDDLEIAAELFGVDEDVIEALNY